MTQTHFTLPPGLVVVTGATGLLGTALVPLLAECRPQALLLATHRRRTEAERLAKTARHLGAGRVEIVQADLGDEAGRDVLIQAVTRAVEPVGALIFLAGINERRLLGTLDPESLSRSLALDLQAPLLLLDRLHGRMPAGGAVVLTGSRAAHTSMPGLAPHAAAKMGLVGALGSLCAELGAKGVRINLVEPGLIRAGEDPEITPYLERVPLGRVGTPQEFAHVVRFLVSEQAGYVTGQVLGVSGGL